MKKKSFLLPAVFLAVSLLACYFLTNLASPFTTYAASNFSFDSAHGKALENYINSYPEICKKAERAYKISPNESTLLALSDLYDPSIRAFGIYNTSDDFYEKCEYYGTQTISFLDSHGNPNMYKGPYYMSNLDLGYGEEWKALFRFSTLTDIAYAQLMQGKTDEAKKTVEKYIDEYRQILKEAEASPESLGPGPFDESAVVIGRDAIGQFFDDTHALSNDTEYKSWVVEKEKELSSLFNGFTFKGMDPADLSNNYYSENYYFNHSLEALNKLYKTPEFS